MHLLEISTIDIVQILMLFCTLSKGKLPDIKAEILICIIDIHILLVIKYIIRNVVNTYIHIQLSCLCSMQMICTLGHEVFNTEVNSL